MPHFFRYGLTRIGGLLSPSQVGDLKGSLRYIELGSLLRQQGYPIERVDNWVKRREDLYDLIGAEVADREVLYMEFGVFEGYATRLWSKLLRNPKTRLHGFDSFEGLPEAWVESKRVMDKGHFSTDGAIPVIDDARVQFFKGWFDQTLATYEVPPHDVLVINFDADLYSSTKCIFDKMSPHIVPGTYLYFDEFNDPQHELRAFIEFRASSPHKFVLRGATALMRQVVFQCVE
jgi:hypothetical protein